MYVCVMNKRYNCLPQQKSIRNMSGLLLGWDGPLFLSFPLCSCVFVSLLSSCRLLQSLVMRVWEQSFRADHSLQSCVVSAAKQPPPHTGLLWSLGRESHRTVGCKDLSILSHKCPWKPCGWSSNCEEHASCGAGLMDEGLKYISRGKI